MDNFLIANLPLKVLFNSFMIDEKKTGTNFLSK